MRDDHLIAMLAKSRKKLVHAADRTAGHQELRDALAETLALELKTLKDAENQLQLLAALEQERTMRNLQTRFLLMADYIDELSTVDEVFFPEEI